MPRWSSLLAVPVALASALVLAVRCVDRPDAPAGSLHPAARGEEAGRATDAEPLRPGGSPGREALESDPSGAEPGRVSGSPPVEPVRSAAPAPDEVRHSRDVLKSSLERFREDRSLTNAQLLMQRAVVAWADHTGSAQHHAPDDPVPEQVLTEEVWSIWVTNRFGSKLVTYTREEFPEYFAIRDLPGPGDSLLDARLDEELLERIDQRAQTVLDLMSAR